jgi:hypothetical protein
VAKQPLPLIGDFRIASPSASFIKKFGEFGELREFREFGVFMKFGEYAELNPLLLSKLYELSKLI